MNALIMTCCTGGGHNSAGIAVKEEFEKRGHSAALLDPYTLAGHNLNQKIGGIYTKMARRTPHLYGAVYKLGSAYSKLPVFSPVYGLNRYMAPFVNKYLSEHQYDVILSTHLFPCEILTYMKNRGIDVPKTFFIATDYTCIPFIEETDCDYYVIPGREFEFEYTMRGIADKKLLPFGIPVKSDFLVKQPRSEALDSLNLNSSKRYLLISGGSMGAGGIMRAVAAVNGYLYANRNTVLIVICGNNISLYNKIKQKYGRSSQMIILQQTDRMFDYMNVCDVFMSKPGGLSSTEAAVSGTPLIHISPIPGCETENMRYFSDTGMSIAAKGSRRAIISSLEKLKNPEYAEYMKAKQHRYINQDAAADLCDFTERIIRA